MQNLITNILSLLKLKVCFMHNLGYYALHIPFAIPSCGPSRSLLLKIPDLKAESVLSHVSACQFAKHREDFRCTLH